MTSSGIFSLVYSAGRSLPICFIDRSLQIPDGFGMENDLLEVVDRIHVVHRTGQVLADLLGGLQLRIDLEIKAYVAKEKRRS